MTFVHPIFQVFSIIIGLYAGYLGWKRFRGMRFPWKRHIQLGLAFLIMIVFGSLMGYSMTYFLKGGIFKTGLHALLPIIIIPSLSIGAILGYLLSKGRRKRTVAAIHMSINYFTMLLIFLQGLYGVEVLLEIIKAK